MSARYQNTKEGKKLCLIWKKDVLSILNSHSREKNRITQNIDGRISNAYELRVQIIKYLNGPNSTYAKKYPRQNSQPPSCEIWSFHFVYNFEGGDSDKLYFKIMLNKDKKALIILSAHKDR